MGRACLDDNEVAELLDGSLGEARRVEIEQHLDGCDACRSLVADLAHLSEAEREDTHRGEEPGEIPEVEVTGAARERALEPGGPLAAIGPGDRVDHFEVLGRLGQGGMGDVYAAWDTKLDRKVALKMVRPRLLGSAEAIARFSREARATARFSHPNIVTIHEVGEYEGRPYVALEFLEGQTLAERMLTDPPGLGEVLRMGLAVAEALAEAHRHGVLHRDLKLHNVHIDEHDRIRVLDFGLAKLLSASEPAAGPSPSLGDSTEDPFETQARTTTGTPMSMAPEQWRGRASHEWTDVWAVGVLLFTLSTGERPFEGTTVRELEAEVVSSTPVRRIDALNPSLPNALADLIAGCLHKEPDQRPTTAQIIEALRALAQPPTVVEARRGRVLVGLGGVVLVGVLAVGWSMRGPERPVEPATAASPMPADRALAAPSPEPIDGAASSPVPSPSRPPVAPQPLETSSSEVAPPEASSSDASPSEPSRPRARPRKRPTPKPDKDTLFGTRE